MLFKIKYMHMYTHKYFTYTPIYNNSDILC